MDRREGALLILVLLPAAACVQGQLNAPGSPSQSVSAAPTIEPPAKRTTLPVEPSAPSAASPQIVGTPLLPPPAASPAPNDVPALTVDEPRLTVTPASALLDGQTVEVQADGFGVGGKVWLSECVSAEAASDLGCGSGLATQTLLVTDESRHGTASFVIHTMAAAGSLETSPKAVCRSRCVVVATLGAGYPFVVAPISFAP